MRHALRSIQRAADLARAGDSIIILPGAYSEWIHVRRGGTTRRPVIFRALRPGTVTITGAAAQHVVHQLAWRAEGAGIFSAATPWPIYLARGDGAILFRTKSVKFLRDWSARPGAWGAFAYASGRVYVHFADNASPAFHRLDIHREVPPLAVKSWSWNAANVLIDADHVRFEGLIFDFGVGAGLRLWNAADVTVSECLFTAATVGVDASTGLRPSTDLRVVHSLYHNYPQAEWRRGWLEYSEVYGSYSQSTLVTSVDDGAIIRNNLVVHGGDGLEVSTRDESIRKGIDVSQNLVAWCTDDAIELDGWAKFVIFAHNLVYDCQQSVSAAPVLAGPAIVRDNLFLHPAGGLNASQVKLMDTRNAADRPGPHVLRNIEITDNTFVGNWMAWYYHGAIQDVRVHDNIFAIRQAMKPPWPHGVTEWHNTYPNVAARYPDPIRDPHWRSRSWTMPRPGPRWLDWHALPATADLPKRMPPDLFTP